MKFANSNYKQYKSTSMNYFNVFLGCLSNYRIVSKIWQRWITSTFWSWQLGFSRGRYQSRIGTYCSTYSTRIHSWRQSLCHGKWVNLKEGFLWKVRAIRRSEGKNYFCSRELKNTCYNSKQFSHYIDLYEYVSLKMKDIIALN